MDSFKAYRVFEEDGRVTGRLVSLHLDELDAGEVVIHSAYSSVNFKDALGATGRGKILKRFPMNGGIDVSGRVLVSASPRFKPGDEVVVTGCGLGENHDGGYSEVVRVPADWVVPLPSGLTLEEAMIFGTAGFTAALCVHRLQMNDQTPTKGPIVVTGASGGVGSMAVSMLASQGFEVIAVTGKTEQHGFLRELGAAQVCGVEDLKLGNRPLESARFGGAIDNVGGDVLAGLIPAINLWGNVASVGLASSPQLSTTVMPFILRGVSILGISSTNAPMPLRQKLWQRMASDLKPKSLHKIHTGTTSLNEMADVFAAMLERKTIGRTIVKF